MHRAEHVFRAMHMFGTNAWRLRRGLDTPRCLQRNPARIALQQMPHAEFIETVGPRGNIDALAALRAFNHRTRARESCDIARQFHGAPPDSDGPVTMFFDFIERAA